MKFAKYLHTAKLGMQTELVYRFNFFIILVKELLSASILLILWLSVYRDGNQLADFSLTQLLVYYFTVSFLAMFMSENVGWMVSEDVERGNVLNFILKPLKSIWYFFAMNFGNKVGKSFFLGPLFLLVFFLLAFLQFISWQSIFLFFVFSLGSFLLSFFVYYLLGTISFFIESSWGIIISWAFTSSFLGGSVLPIEAFPPALAQLSMYLPFQYLYYVPATVLSGNFDSLFIPLCILVLWILFFALLGYAAWSVGANRYEAYGR